MYEVTPAVVETAPNVTAAPKAMLAMAILAPFGVIALMASPLVLDAVRHAVGHLAVRSTARTRTEKPKSWALTVVMRKLYPELCGNH